MTREDLAVLIDAYADAKATRNQHLIRVSAAQLEDALNSMFTEATPSPDAE
jgi:hypothetical protein